MIKVLHIVPGIEGGGVGQIVLNYGKKIDKESFSIDLVSLRKLDGSPSRMYDLYEKEFNRVYLLERNYIARIKCFYKILKTNRYDIVHCHMEESSALYLFIALLCGVKVRIAQTHIAQIPYFFSKKSFKRIFRPLLFILTTHKYACGEKAGRRLWGKKDFYILNNAIEMDSFVYKKTIRDEIRRELNIEDQAFVITTVGRLIDQKNPFFVIQLLEKLKKCLSSFVFLWVGDGPLLSDIKEKLKEFGIENNVRLLGLRKDVGRILMGADAFLLPSKYEGLPIVGIEAQTSGLPLLFSDTITDEILLLPTTKQLPLNDFSVWIDAIVQLAEKGCNRTKQLNMLHSIYDINVAVKKLEKEYISFVAKTKSEIGD